MDKESVNREVGLRIRNLRVLRGIERSAIAKYLGVNLSHMGLIERGKRGLTIHNCLRLSELLCVSTDYILGGKCKMRKCDRCFSEIAFTAK